MSANRRTREPDLGYLDFDELPYRESTAAVPCAHWLLGDRHPLDDYNRWFETDEEHRAWRREREACQNLNDGRFPVGLDHWHALLPGGGRRVLLNQPYAGRGNHYEQAQRFAEAWGLDAIPVAERTLAEDPLVSTSAVLFVRAGVDVADVVAELRARWLELVPDATAPRFSETARVAHPAGRALPPREVEDGAPAADDNPSVVRSED